MITTVKAKIMELNNWDKVYIHNTMLGCMQEQNGYITDMDEFDSLFEFTSHSDLMMRAFCGSDYGHENSKFNPNAEWFTIDGYGNLVSVHDYWIDDIVSNSCDWYLADLIECDNEFLDELEYIGIEIEENP